MNAIGTLATLRPAPRPTPQRGAALLTAMLTVTLVASFAAAALWEQWRSIEVETAERARVQSAWILIGALDWSRLILREDALAQGDGTDNLTEPWSVPLEEARLSTFLAAERGVSQVDDASTDTRDAFLSGSIHDMQSRLNLANLAPNGQIDPTALRQLERLFDYLGLPAAQLTQLTQQWQASQRPLDAGNSQRPLAPQSVAQLAWLGLPADSLALLAPHLSVLPAPTKVNLNTASAVVLWASADGLEMAQAQQLVQARDQQYFASVNEAARQLQGNASDSGQPTDTGGNATPSPIRASLHSVDSHYFEVQGRLRLGSAVVQENALIYKQRGQTRTLWRQRSSLAWGVGAPNVEP